MCFWSAYCYTVFPPPALGQFKAIIANEEFMLWGRNTRVWHKFVDRIPAADCRIIHDIYMFTEGVKDRTSLEGGIQRVWRDKLGMFYAVIFQ